MEINIKDGYFINKTNKIKTLDNLKVDLYNLLQEIFNFNYPDIDYGLNNFHIVEESLKREISYGGSSYGWQVSTFCSR